MIVNNISAAQPHFKGRLELSSYKHIPWEKPEIKEIAKVKIPKEDDRSLYKLFLKLKGIGSGDDWFLGREKDALGSVTGGNMIDENNSIKLSNEIVKLLELPSETNLFQDYEQKFEYWFSFNGRGDMEYAIQLRNYIIRHHLHHKDNSEPNEIIK